MTTPTELHNKPIVRQFGKFGIVGASSTIIDFGIYNLLIQFAHFSPYLAHACSFIVAVCNSYYWNSRWTFKGRRNREAVQEFRLFIAISVVGLGLTEAIIAGILYIIPLPHIPIHWNAAKAIATMGVVLWNFFANRHWTFPKQNQRTQ